MRRPQLCECDWEMCDGLRQKKLIHTQPIPVYHDHDSCALSITDLYKQARLFRKNYSASAFPIIDMYV